jgi:polyisoprenoid-binding protein YceI
MVNSGSHSSSRILGYCLGALLACLSAGLIAAAEEAKDGSQAPKDSGQQQKTMMANGHLGDCRSCHGKPDPNRFMVDSARSRLVFQVDNYGFGPAIGESRRIEGAFWFDPNNTAKVFAVATIHANTIDFGDPLMNAVVRERFLDAEKFPDMTFVARSIQRTASSEQGRIIGDFTMLGVTKQVTLNVQFDKIGRHPLTGEYSAGFTATGSLKRSDFGQTLGLPAIGDDISFEIVLLGKNLQ